MGYALPSYRCFFIGHDDHIAGPPEVIEADALGEAIDLALAMLQARPHHRGIELWEGAKRLYPVQGQGLGGDPGV
jgi:hypothetical protein